MNQFKKIVALGICCLSITFSQAQFTKANNDPDADFKTAKEYLQREQFSLAYPIFKNIYNNGIAESAFPVTLQLEAKYYSVVCGLKLNDASSEPLAAEFISLEHNAPRVQMMSFYLAEYYYRQRKFGDANNYYAKATIDNLTNNEIASMKFHQAYGFFTLQDFAKAKPLFNAIRQLPEDPNYMDANYYYGFISFYEKNYKQALESFKVVEASPAYKNLVPFYIA
ncbi:MAG: hypothetical protein H7178_11675, partial [Chitinophagaceae bacterium]|nr:hypothetical protein [Chitinophagaceae bacterium]